MRFISYSLFIFPALLIISCAFPENEEEYFCEQRKSNDHDYYQQSSIIIKKDIFCHNYDNQTACAPFGALVQGAGKFESVDEYEDTYKKINFYKSTKVSNDVYKLEKFEKLLIKTDSKVTKKLIKDRWHFYFNNDEMHYTLPAKDASEESIATFELYAADDNLYCYIRNSCYGAEDRDAKFKEELNKILSHSLKNPADEKKTISEFDGFKKLPLVVGNKKYNYFLSYIRGDYLERTYVFDKKNLQLSITPRIPILEEAEKVISCELWAKQKWYEFP